MRHGIYGPASFLVSVNEEEKQQDNNEEPKTTTSNVRLHQ